jgi:Flp pilus assembly protein TadG
MPALVARLTRRIKNQSGAILVLTGVMMVAFIGMAALAIDVGSFYQAQRQAQGAADAGALAALHDLPSSPGTASTDATNMVAQNYPGSTAVVTTPATTGGSTSSIKVVVSQSTPAFFGQIFGITSANVSATAIASTPPGITPAALFAADTNCSHDGILIHHNDITIKGPVTSNSELTLQDTGMTFGATLYGGPNNCAASGTSGNTFQSRASHSDVLPFPYDYTLPALTPACTSSVTGNHTMSTSDAPGVWCVTGTITLPSGINLNGYTLKAANFSFGGNGITVTPASTGNGLSLWDTGTSNLDINIGTFSGDVIFAPSAEVVLDSSPVTLTGFIEANDILLDTHPITINGTGPPSGGFAGALTG